MQQKLRETNKQIDTTNNKKLDLEQSQQLN